MRRERSLPLERARRRRARPAPPALLVAAFVSLALCVLASIVGLTLCAATGDASWPVAVHLVAVVAGLGFYRVLRREVRLHAALRGKDGAS